MLDRTTAKENVTNRDYLQNLYDHLKGLAIVVAESEATSKGKLVNFVWTVIVLHMYTVSLHILFNFHCCEF